MLSAIGLGIELPEGKFARLGLSPGREVVVEHASECRHTGGNDTHLVFNKADR